MDTYGMSTDKNMFSNKCKKICLCYLSRKQHIELLTYAATGNFNQKKKYFLILIRKFHYIKVYSALTH